MRSATSSRQRHYTHLTTAHDTKRTNAKQRGRRSTRRLFPYFRTSPPCLLTRTETGRGGGLPSWSRSENKTS